MEAREAASPARVLDGAIVASVFALLAVSLGQDSFYKVDGHGLLRYLAGEGTHPRHPLTIPVLRGFRAVLEPFGLSDFRVVTLASAVCTACGVFAAQLGFVQLRLSRARAALASILVASCPALIFFATVVEFHGVFFAFAGGSFALFARLVAQAGHGAALLAGASVGIAAAVHGLGHFLTPVLGFWAALEARQAHACNLRKMLLHGCEIALAHALVFVLVQLLVGAEAATSQASFFDDALASRPDVARLPMLLWNEWLRPYAGMSIALFCCLRAKRHALSPASLSLALAVIALLVTTWVLVPKGDERGAYLTPLSLLAALALVRSVPLRALGVTAALSLALAIAELRVHDRPSRSGAWMQAFRSISSSLQAEVFPLVAAIEEVDALARYDALRPSLVAVDLQHGLAGAASEQELELRCAGIANVLRQIEASGKRVLVTESWRQAMRETPETRRALEVLEAAWRLEAKLEGAYRFYVLTQRGR